MNRIMEKIKQFVLAHYLKKSWSRSVKALAMVVVFVTTYMLILPAITISVDPSCGLEEHIHTEECYTPAITHKIYNCSLTSDGKIVHKHDENCFVNGVLMCTLEESEAHIHTDSCYPLGRKTLICGYEEADFSSIALPLPGEDFYEDVEDIDSFMHEHTDACYRYEGTPVCGLEEIELHTHTEECYISDENGNRIPACGKEEVLFHQHTENCFVTDRTEAKLLCEKAEHTHEESCYIREETDMDSEKTIESAENIEETADSPGEEDIKENADLVEDENADMEEDAEEPDKETAEIVEADKEETLTEETLTEETLIEEAETVETETVETEKSQEDNILSEVIEEDSIEAQSEWNENGQEAETETFYFEEIIPENDNLFFYFCGKTVHLHKKECFDEDGILICDKEEHEHTEECLVSEGREIVDEIPVMFASLEPGAVDLKPHITAVTGEGTIYEAGTEYYKTNLQIKFSIQKYNIVAANYTYKYEIPAGVEVPEGLFGNQYNGYDDSNKHAFMYEFINDGGKNYIQIKYDPAYVNLAEDKVDAFISFRGMLNGNASNDQGGYHIQFSENSTLDIPPEKINYPDGETLNYQMSLSKSQSNDNVPKDYIQYEMKISSTKGTTGITLEDIAAQTGNANIGAVELVSVKKGPMYRSDLAKDVNASDYTFSRDAADQKSFSMTLPPLEAGEEYNVVYRYKVDGLGENQSTKIQNTAHAETGDHGQNIEKEAQCTVEKSNSTIAKSGYYDNNSHEVQWTIEVNNSEGNIAGALVTDPMFAEMTEAQLRAVITPGNGFTIETSNGKVTGIRFSGVNGSQENKQKYTIRYTQKPESTWAGGTVSNTATFKPGSGEGTTVGPINVPIPGGGAEKSAISGTGAVNGEIHVSWNINVIVPVSGMPANTKIEDTLEQEADFPQWMTFVQMSNWAGSIGNSSEGWLGLADADSLQFYGADGSWHKYSDILTDPNLQALKYTKYSFIFKNGISPDSEYAGKTLSMQYTSKADVSKAGESHAFKNNVDVGGIQKQASYTYTSRVIKTDGNWQTGVTNVDSKDGYVNWIVKIHQEDNTDELTVIDTLPKEVELVEFKYGQSYINDYGTTTVVLNENGSFTTQVVGGSVSKLTHTAAYDKDSNEISIQITDTEPQNKPDILKVGGTLYIYYTCKIKEKYMPATGETLTLPGLTNYVRVKRGSTDYGAAEQTQNVTVKSEKPKEKQVFKSGYWNNEERQLIYDVDLNPGAADLLTGSSYYHFKDELRYDHNHLSEKAELRPETVSLYYAKLTAEGVPEKDANGRLIKDTAVQASEWNWKFTTSEQGNNRINTIAGMVPDGKALILEYIYAVHMEIPDEKQEYDLLINNSLTVYGDEDSSDNSSTSDKWKESDTSGGASMNKLYTFYKVDTSDYSQRLSGAEFTIGKVNADGTEEDLSIKYTTTDGMFIIKWADGYYQKNTGYYVYESKTPDGYKLPQPVPRYYFYFSEGETEMPEAFIAKKPVDLSKEARTEYCENVEDIFYYTLKKTNVDNNGISGAVFTLFKYNNGAFESTGHTYTTDEKGELQLQYQRDSHGEDYQFDVNTAYYIVETAAPNGYVLPDAAKKFFFYFSKDHGQISGPENFVSAYGALDVSTASHSVTCKNDRMPYLVKLYKKDVVNQGTMLSGAEFTLFEYSSSAGDYVNTGAVFTTDSNGYFEISWENTKYPLKFDTEYYLVETKAPDSYELPLSPTKFYFHCTSEADVEGEKVTNIPASGYHDDKDLKKGEQSFTCYNAKKHVYQITKVDALQKTQTLDGAVFALYEYDLEKGSFFDTNHKFTTVDGVIQISRASYPFKVNTAYYVKEISSPEGYQLPDDPELYRFYFWDPSDESQYNPKFPNRDRDNYDSLGAVNLMEQNKEVICENSPSGYKVSAEKNWHSEDGNPLPESEIPGDVRVKLKRYAIPESEWSSFTKTQGKVNVSYRIKDNNGGQKNGSLEVPAGTKLQLTFYKEGSRYNSFEPYVEFTPNISFTNSGTLQSDTLVCEFVAISSDMIKIEGEIRNPWGGIELVNPDNQENQKDRWTISLSAIDTPAPGVDPSKLTPENLNGYKDAGFERTGTLNSAGSWKYDWNYVPATNNAGNVHYVYYVEETNVPNGFEVAYSGNYLVPKEAGSTVTVINTKSNRPETVDIKVQKKWYDSNGTEKVSPPVNVEVVLELLRKLDEVQDTSFTEQVTFSNGTWEKTWTGLQKKADTGNEYVYYVEEISVNGETPDEKYDISYDSSPGGDDLYILTAKNQEKKTYVLPETGGIGPESYTLAGKLLIMFALLLLYIKYKRGKEENVSS